MIKIKNVNIDLKSTIECGQIFRYEKNIDGTYNIILKDRVVNIKKENNNLIIKSNNEENLNEIITEYFDLDRDYNQINKFLIEKDNSIKDIIDSLDGFKIIKQPRLECIISYILSSNNGVPQIKNSLDLISEEYGQKVIFDEKEYYLFPSIDKLKDVKIEDYRKLKTGFRDKYIYEIVQNIYNKNFLIDEIDKMDSTSAMEYLMKNKGIGEKVSSCILLFSYSRLDVFPIDTWVKKYMKDKYNIEGIDNIKKFSYEKYKDYSALVIQYMFHYKRNIEK